MDWQTFTILLVLIIPLHFGMREIANAIKGKEPEDIKKNALGKVEKAEIIKKIDPIDELLKQ